MRLPLSLKGKWDEDFTNMILGMGLERQDFYRSKTKPRGRHLVADICHFTINDKNLVALRIAAFRKFLSVNGTLDTIGYTSTHDLHLIDDNAQELIDLYGIGQRDINSTRFNMNDSIYEYEYVIRNNFIAPDEEDKLVNIKYYLAMFKNADDDAMGFRIEVPFIFGFTEEMLSAYHESFQAFKEIYMKMRSSDLRLTNTFKMRDGAEFAALFMYVFWDEMNEIERKYVVPSILLTVVTSEPNYRIRDEVFHSNLSNYGFMSQYLGTIFENSDYKKSMEKMDEFLFGPPAKSFQDFDNEFGSVFARMISRISRGAYHGSINIIHLSEETMVSEDVHPLFGCIGPILNKISYDDSYGMTQDFVSKNMENLPEIMEFAKEQFSGPTALKWILNGNTVEEANKFYEVGIKSPEEVGENAKIMDSWVSAWSDS